MAKKPQISPNIQIKPLSIPSPSPSPSPSKPYFQTHRLLLLLLAISGATVLLLGLILLLLALTLFKLQNPRLTLNSIRIDRLLLPSLSNPISFNATLAADLSINNPNAASFRFRRSTTDFFYAGALVGVAYAPEGKVRPRRTLRINVTVEVMAEKVFMETNATAVAFRDGAVNLTSFTDVSGRVDLLGVYKRDLDVLLNCSFTLGVFDSSFLNRVCEGNVL